MLVEIYTDWIPLNVFAKLDCAVTNSHTRYNFLVQISSIGCILHDNEGITEAKYLHWLKIRNVLVESLVIDGRKLKTTSTFINGFKSIVIFT